ncbi:hypothetical protein GCM10027610_116770 [Dactylosporangium cerinum]
MTSGVTGVQPPTAKQVPHERTHHGDTVVDEYFWLQDKEDPDTVAYLEAENAFTTAATAHLASLRETAFNEIKSRTKETDLSVPTRKGGFWYYTRTEEGKQYGIHCRVPAAAGQTTPPELGDGGALPDEQILLDGNELAGDSEFFALGTFDISPDGRRLAYSTDFAGDERFTLRVKDLETGELLPDTVEDAFYGSAWSGDGSTLFYITVDEAWRPNRIWRHALGTTGEDVIVHEETDERFWVGVDLTRSERFILIDIHSKITSEVLVIPADAPTSPPLSIAPRRQGVEYSVEHHGHRFLILHNDGAEDFALSYTSADAPGAWITLIEHEPGTRLLGVDAFSGHLVVSLRRDGLTGIRVVPLHGAAPYDIAFPEPIYSAGPEANLEYDTTSFRLHYVSLVTPDSVFDCNLDSGKLTLRKQKPVLGDFDPARYEQHREWALAEDGTRVPISIVARAGTPATARPPPSSTATAPTRPRWTPGSRSPACRCSTAASSSPSPTSAAAARWAAAGMTRASSWPRRTRSPTSSPPPSTWSRPAGPRRTSSSPAAAPPAAYSWALWPTSPRRPSPASSPRSPSSTRSTPSSTRPSR